MPSLRVRVRTWALGVLLALGVGVYLTLALRLKSDGVGGDGPWGPTVPYLAVGAIGVGLVAFVTGWNALWLWPLATFVVAVGWEELLWEEPPGRYFADEAIGAYPTIVVPLLVVFVPAVLVGVRARRRLDEARRTGWLAPLEHPWRGAIPTWAVLALLQIGGFAWFFAARWYLDHAGHRVFAGLGGDCLRGSPGFAHWQGAIALVGLLALAVAVAARTHEPWAGTRVARGSVVIAAAAFAVWCVAVIGFQPRHDLGIYAGCGGA